MRFFRRGEPEQSPIDGFWAWWADARDRVAASIENGTPGDQVDAISSRVNRINDGLAWELARGANSKHALVVSPEGNPAIRSIALRWLAAAPPADATWEYYAARQPGALGMLEAGGVRLDLSDVRAIASWNSDRQRVHVRLWHPALEGQPDSTQSQVAFLFLDNLLGEETVERWIGAIDVLEAAIVGRTPEELRDEVKRQTAAADEESWTLATRADRKGEEAIVLVNTAIKPIDYPFHQHHAVVTVAAGAEYLAANEGESDIVNEAEDRLVEAMAAASAVYLGRVTERRRRQIHFVCQDPDAAKSSAEAWAKTERRLQPAVQVRSEPGWSFRDELGL
jgi:Family of unknown function (DUF695)